MEVPSPMRLIRWRQGMTITELARRTGLARQTIYDVENGVRPNASIDTLTRIAQALGVTVDELLEPERVA